ncbi:MAG: ABC transporter ATP-binding protein [Bacteroidota bacterium]
MIEVKHLTKIYGDIRAVDDVSFALSEGQTLALVGTSGSGKTTTLKMLNRLIEPSAGSIKVKGKEVMDMSPVDLRRQMGYVIQQSGLFPHYTVAQNVGIVPKLLGWDEKKIRERAFSLLERLALEPKLYADKYPDQLSGGQQQRVGLARALAADPPIILMDEPFGALDPLTRHSIRKEFKELEELSSKTTLIVTHDIEEAFYLGDLICVLDQGKIQQIGTPQELLWQPANHFVRDFVAGERINLQWQIFSLSDLFSLLPPLLSDRKYQDELPANLNVREALDQMLQTETIDAQFMVKHRGESRALDMPSLVNAFHQISQDRHD